MFYRADRPQDKHQAGIYLGVRISLYCSFSTRVVAATDMGITMLLMSKELSPRLLLMGCCWATKEDVEGSVWMHTEFIEDVHNNTLIHHHQMYDLMFTGFKQHLCDSVNNDIFTGGVTYCRQG